MPLSKIQTTLLSGDTSDSVLRSLLVPPAPTGLTATGRNEQVLLSWSVPTVLPQTPITDYTKQYSSDNGATWTTFMTATSTATSATVTGLTNGTAYRFRVAAINSVGVGAYTAASSAATPFPARLLLTFDTSLDDIAQGLTASQTGSGPARSTDQTKGGTHSLFVGSAFGNATTRRLQYGSGSTWDIMHGDCTVECWIYVTAENDYRGIVGRDNLGNARHWNLYINSQTENNNLGFSVFNTGNTPFVELVDPAALPLNQWVHIAVVRDGGFFRLYKNGTQVASANVSSGSGTIGTASGALTVGALSDAGVYALPGYIDELLITDGCRYPNGTTFTPSSFI